MAEAKKVVVILLEQLFVKMKPFSEWRQRHPANVSKPVSEATRKILTRKRICRILEVLP